MSAMMENLCFGIRGILPGTWVLVLKQAILPIGRKDKAATTVFVLETMASSKLEFTCGNLDSIMIWHWNAIFTIRKNTFRTYQCLMHARPEIKNKVFLTSIFQ